MCNKNCGIYKITSPSGKIYIGQSVNIKRRWSDYKSISRVKNQIILYKSFKKHGIENHQFDIIEYCSEEDLNCSERFWQDQFNVIGKNGLNCILTECGEKRRIYTEEFKEKMRTINLGNKYWKGKFHTEETKKKMSYNVTGKNNINYKKVYTEGEKLQLSSKMKNRVNLGEKNGNVKIILCSLTGIFYYGVREASIAKAINFHSLAKMLMGKKLNKTTLSYV